MTGLVAGRIRADIINGVGATSGAIRHGIAFDVGCNISRETRVSVVFLFFQRPLFLRAINLAEVVDAGVRLCSRTSFHEVRNSDRRQQADDGHNDHDFYERETRLTGCFNFHN